MLINYRENLNEKLVELRLLQVSKTKHKLVLSHLEKEYDILQKSKDVFQKAAILTQNDLARHISVIVTKAVRATFPDKKVNFKVEFIERRNVTECDMWFEENDYKYSLLESRGYGMTDIASFALRVAYVLLHPSDNVLVIDEPFRNLGENNHELASLMIKELANELRMQFIILTHVPTLREYSDKSFHIIQKKGISNSY